MQKLIFSLLLIISGLICGYILQHVIRHKVVRHDLLLPKVRKALQWSSILGIMPIAFIGALWAIPLNDLRLSMLPLIGAAVLTLGGILGWGSATLMGKPGPQKSTLFCCGAFTNIGVFGGLFSFVFFGEKGFALVALYKLFEETLYYSIGFPIARYIRSADEQLKFKSRLLEIFRDPFFLTANGAFLLGLYLNLSEVARPEFYETLNNYFVPIGTFMLLVSIGLSLRVSKVGQHLKDGMIISLTKFILLPLFAFGATYISGLHEVQDGLVLKVVLICASMPVAFNTLVAASIYDLDLELANSCWLITTAGLAVILPTLYVMFSFF